MHDTSMAPSANGAVAELPYYGRMEWVHITPEVARQMLGLNHANRKLRSGRVRMYAGDIAGGQWVHETAAPMQVFGDELHNGQHRLAAVVMADVSIWSWVQFLPVRPTEVAIIDTALTRGANDLFGISTGLAAAARVLTVIGGGSNQVSLQSVRLVSERISDQFEQMTGTSRRGFTLSPVQAAVCFSMWRYPDDADEIVMQYNAEAKDENGRTLWPGFHAAARQVMRRSTGGRVSNVADVFLRVARGLDQDGRYLDTVAFKDQSIYRGKVSPLIRRYIGLDEE